MKQKKLKLKLKLMMLMMMMLIAADLSRAPAAKGSLAAGVYY